jgi:hypothetical protein
MQQLNLQSIPQWATPGHPSKAKWFRERSQIPGAAHPENPVQLSSSDSV